MQHGPLTLDALRGRVKVVENELGWLPPAELTAQLIRSNGSF